MKKLLPWLLLLVGLLAVGWFWRSHRAAGEAPDEEAKPTAQVQTVPLKRQEISRSLAAFGVVEAPGTHAVTLGYDGVIRTISASAVPGTRVAADELLMEVAPTADAQLQLDSARSAANLAEKAQAAMQQRYDLRLANNQDLLSAQQAAEDARIKLASYQKRIGGAGGRIVSETAGIVTKLDWSVGATVPAGTVLAVVTDSSDLEAHLTVEAADAGLVRAGQSVTVRSANRPGLDPLAGSVRMVGGSVDPASGAVDVRVPLPAGSAWYPGEHVQAAIELERKTALVAPRAAVLPDDDKQVLFTVKDHKAVKHEVELGIASDDAVEVAGPDLQAGDEAVVVGNYELEDGMAVQAAAPGPKGAPDEKAEAKP